MYVYKPFRQSSEIIHNGVLSGGCDCDGDPSIRTPRFRVYFLFFNGSLDARSSSFLINFSNAT